MGKRHYVYSLRSRGRTTYIGKTTNPKRRAAQHKSDGKTGEMKVEKSFDSHGKARRSEAVRLANDTPFGLGAVVFGGDRATEVARKMTAGMIGINKSCGGAEGTPWVGARQSGYSFHSSKDGHRNFTQTRVVSVKA